MCSVKTCLCIEIYVPVIAGLLAVGLFFWRSCLPDSVLKLLSAVSACVKLWILRHRLNCLLPSSLWFKYSLQTWDKDSNNTDEWNLRMQGVENMAQIYVRVKFIFLYSIAEHYHGLFHGFCWYLVVSGVFLRLPPFSSSSMLLLLLFQNWCCIRCQKTSSCSYAGAGGVMFIQILWLLPGQTGQAIPVVLGGFRSILDSLPHWGPVFSAFGECSISVAVWYVLLGFVLYACMFMDAFIAPLCTFQYICNIQCGLINMKAWGTLLMIWHIN